MKQSLKQTLFIAGLVGAVLTINVQAQENGKPRRVGDRQLGATSNGKEKPKQRFGAPKSMQRDGQRKGDVDRRTIRKPFDRDNFDKSNKTKGQDQGSGKPRKPKGGMSRAERPDKDKKPDLRKVLGLTEEQAKALHEARKKWHAYAKSIIENKELSKEDKQAKLREGFKRHDAKVREILTEKQYAQLREMQRRRARPENREEHAKNDGKRDSKPNGADHRRRIAEALKLTDEQKRKLRAVHEHAVKRIRGILNNKELSKEDKDALIKKVHKGAHARRQEILTDEQKSRLRGILAYLRSKRENESQPVHNKPRGRHDDKSDRPNAPKPDGGKDNARKFPPHWGNPPAVQTRDYVKLPGNFGHGSSTLANWIEENIKRDKKRRESNGNTTTKPR